jgi:type II secretory pathway component PulM
MTYQVKSDDSDTAVSITPSPAEAGSETSGTGGFPTKVCPGCSVQSQTDGNFCPHCASSYSSVKPRKISRRIVIGVVAALVAAGSVTGLVLKISHDHQVTAERAAAAQVQEQAAEAAKATADAAAAEVAAKQAADDTTRTVRQSAVTEMEAAILKDAKARVSDQTLTGPILSATCTPLGGGSVDDLTALTGTFECIAVNKKNADGSSQGYRFASTINWNEGTFTWHLGS